jgi:ribosomal protein S18 acetylase RimI-like enzyme
VFRLGTSTDIEHILAMDPSAEADPFRRALVLSAVEHRECFVAEENGVLLGYGVMNYGFFHRGFVSLIYVNTAHRRRRIASGLFDQFEERCRSSRIFTSTNLSNLPMQSFLVFRGYVVSGVVQDLDERDPELFYSKRLR